METKNNIKLPRLFVIVSFALGLVLAAELGFYIPLGFFAIAFH